MDEKIIPVIGNAQIENPPLKERSLDVLSLARYFIEVANEQVNTGHKGLSKEAEEYLLSGDWRDKEKELEIAVKKACILSEGPVLNKEDFDLRYRQMKCVDTRSFLEEKLKGFMRNIKKFEEFNLYETVIPEIEKALILMVLKETKGNQIRAAKILGINRNTLRDKIKKLKVSIKP